MFAVPRFPLLHGPQRATMTFPAFPGLPMWMWAAAAGPVSFANLSFHVSVARPLALACTAVPVNVPVAPALDARWLGHLGARLESRGELVRGRLRSGERQTREGHDDRETRQNEEG